jgi:hypothetical protein
MLDVNLDPRAVGWEQVDGHAPLFPDEPGLGALGKQLGFDHSLLGLAGLRIGIAHRQQQALRRFARLDLACALSREGDAHAELASLRKLALYLPVPVGQSLGIGECSPEVIDPGVEAIFHPHDALAID